MSYVYQTYVQHMSHICGTYVSNMCGPYIGRMCNICETYLKQYAEYMHHAEQMRTHMFSTCCRYVFCCQNICTSENTILFSQNKTLCSQNKILCSQNKVLNIKNTCEPHMLHICESWEIHLQDAEDSLFCLRGSTGKTICTNRISTCFLSARNMLAFVLHVFGHGQTYLLHMLHAFIFYTCCFLNVPPMFHKCFTYVSHMFHTYDSTYVPHIWFHICSHIIMSILLCKPARWLFDSTDIENNSHTQHGQLKIDN